MIAKTKIRVAIATLGCKVNQYESAAFQSSFLESGVELVAFSSPADLYVINTCAVTSKAGAQSRQTVRKALKQNPEARVVVTGCYAQIDPQKLLEITDGPICLVGNGYKHRLVDIALSAKQCDLEIHMGNIGSQEKIAPLLARAFPGRTRAYLKLQDGCNNFCSYCIVPYARGRSRSLPLKQVKEQVQVFVDQGFKEIVLTGIHVGMYGRDFAKPVSLPEAIAEIISRAPHIRFRLSSIEPGELSDSMLELFCKSPNLMPHFHIPLQSGDPDILHKMNRHYSPGKYRERVRACLDVLPDLALGADILVGFPGETEAQFLNTKNMIDELPFAYLHVFPYSRRPGTVAASMPDQISSSIKEERVACLRNLDHKKRNNFYNKNLDRPHEVLVETNRSGREGNLKGYSENYIPIQFKGSSKLINSIVTVQAKRIEDGVVYGDIIDVEG